LRPRHRDICHGRSNARVGRWREEREKRERQAWAESALGRGCELGQLEPSREREGVESWAARAVGPAESEGEFLLLFLLLKIHYMMNLIKFVIK
jgi:hypothetical protein